MTKIFFHYYKNTLQRNLKIILVAIVIDAIWGDPKQFYEKFSHPVIWIGKLINLLDQKLNKPNIASYTQKKHGFYALFFIVTIPSFIGFLLQKILFRLFYYNLAIFLSGIIGSIFIAQRSLYEHVDAVRKEIDQKNLTKARLAVSKIVGRETKHLDQSSICRAAIESLAENFSDGVIAPIFWGYIGGLPGIIAYKAINTADSMIGHLTKRYQHFGYAAAKTDDYVNYPAARLSALYILLCSNNFFKNLKQTFQNAKKHNSPNAGWPEAAMAHCLNIQLAGPRQYKEQVINTPYIGKGRKHLTSTDIKKALINFNISSLINYILLILLLTFLFINNKKE